MWYKNLKSFCRSSALIATAHLVVAIEDNDRLLMRILTAIIVVTASLGWWQDD